MRSLETGDPKIEKNISTSHGNNAKGWVPIRRNYNSLIDHCVSCTTFNILAPIYKRVDKENENCRESEYRTHWLSRNEKILERLLNDMSSIICLQEFWIGNPELVNLYEKRLSAAGYVLYNLARTNNRGDGLVTAVHKDYFAVLNYRELLFNDFGDRVAQLLHVEAVVPFWQSRNNSACQQILVMNTHLLFPHNSSLSILRLHQVYKILQYLEAYQKEHNLGSIPIILCGDWNGSKRGHVYKFLRSQGFISSYDAAHHYTDSDADAHKWISHRNHRGNICGVDFIWLLNPNKHRIPLDKSWSEAVFGIIKHQLRGASLSENDAFAFLKADVPGDFITYSCFCQALNQLGLLDHSLGLGDAEAKNLWFQADIDRDGVVNYNEFQRIWNPSSQHMEENKEEEEGRRNATANPDVVMMGFDVKNAYLFPPEVEKEGNKAASEDSNNLKIFKGVFRYLRKSSITDSRDNSFELLLGKSRV